MNLSWINSIWSIFCSESLVDSYWLLFPPALIEAGRSFNSSRNKRTIKLWWPHGPIQAHGVILNCNVPIPVWFSCRSNQTNTHRMSSWVSSNIVIKAICIDNFFDLSLTAKYCKTKFLRYSLIDWKIWYVQIVSTEYKSISGVRRNRTSAKTYFVMKYWVIKTNVLIYLLFINLIRPSAFII